MHVYIDAFRRRNSLLFEAIEADKAGKVDEVGEISRRSN